MSPQEAFLFIEKGFKNTNKIWADLGAGDGTFTIPMSELLGKNGEIHAIDLDPKVLKINNLNRSSQSAKIITYQKDFTKKLDLPLLDGIFIANALHYVEDQKSLLQQLIPMLRSTGKILLIEYDREDGNSWVPYPISFSKLKKLASEVGLTPPLELNRKRSRFGNVDLYFAEMHIKS